MTYQHLGAAYESAVTDRHKFWQDKRDNLKNGIRSILRIFSTEKREMEVIRARRSHTNFCGKKFRGRCTIKIVPTHK